MEILYNVSDDLLSLSRGDIRTYEEATSRFVSALRQERDPQATGIAIQHPLSSDRK